MKKHKFIAPYDKKGKTTYPKTVNKSGCYLIKENNKLVYVGYSGINLYRTMYRHFETWNHSQKVVSYKEKLSRNKYTVRVVLCTKLQASALEKALILKHKPRDNENKYALYELSKYDENIQSQYERIEEVEVPF